MDAGRAGPAACPAGEGADGLVLGSATEDRDAIDAGGHVQHLLVVADVVGTEDENAKAGGNRFGLKARITS